MPVKSSSAFPALHCLGPKGTSSCLPSHYGPRIRSIDRELNNYPASGIRELIPLGKSYFLKEEFFFFLRKINSGEVFPKDDGER